MRSAEYFATYISKAKKEKIIDNVTLDPDTFNIAGQLRKAISHCTAIKAGDRIIIDDLVNRLAILADHNHGKLHDDNDNISTSDDYQHRTTIQEESSDGSNNNRNKLDSSAIASIVQEVKEHNDIVNRNAAPAVQNVNSDNTTITTNDDIDMDEWDQLLTSSSEGSTIDYESLRNSMVSNMRMLLDGTDISAISKARIIKEFKSWNDGEYTPERAREFFQQAMEQHKQPIRLGYSRPGVFEQGGQSYNQSPSNDSNKGDSNNNNNDSPFDSSKSTIHPDSTMTGEDDGIHPSGSNETNDSGKSGLQSIPESDDHDESVDTNTSGFH